jgi:S-adenosylmethionine-diacylgycerolhomoserine-N-methlytransferase
MNAIVSDAERMDRHYRYQRYIYDSTRTHYLIGRKHLIRKVDPKPGESVLEIGCGTAWNLARIAKRYPKARLFGIDVSTAMLQTAAASLKRQGIEGVTLRQGDATNFDPAATFGRAEFDRVIFSYALSMIPCWREALSHSAGLIAPGGALHIVDFGQCEKLPTPFKRGLFAFLKHYTVVPRPDLESVARAIAAERGLSCEMTRLHRGYTDYAVLRRT